MTRDRFTAATWRLTLWYLAILMGISVAFSVALYRVSSNEIGNGFRKEIHILQPFVGGSLGQPRDFLEARENALAQSNAHLRGTLYIYNVIILVVGGAVCYMFARRTLRPIQSALEAQSRFTADASHELRTPLTAMRSEIEVALRDRTLSLGDAKELLGSNLEEVNRLETLSRNLLKLAHYDEGTETPEFSDIALKPLAQKTLKAVEKMNPNSKVELASELTPLKLQADASDVQELLTILLDNAIKYSPKGGTVTVRTYKEGHDAKLSVQDHGVGIKPEDLPHLFDRFYRADTSRSKLHTNGYGLGLSIAKSIVKAHSGRIDVDSKPGKGTTFTVSLPLVHKKDEINLPI